MTWGATFIVIMAFLFLLFLIGEWVAFALGTAGIIGLLLFGTPNALASMSAIGSVIWNNSISYTMTAIPLFIFMGEIVLRSDISMKFYRGLSKLIGRLPGGLLQSNIAATAFFAAISGSAIATAAAIGSVAIPEMTKRRYDSGMIFGSLAAGGTLGLLIPPSIPLIVYGTLTNQSVTKLFIAGIVPGVIMAIIFMIYIGFRCVGNRHLTPKPEVASAKEKLAAIGDVLPLLLLMVCILGCIYAGIATPTEVAALGAVLSCVLAVFNKKFNAKMVRDAMFGAVKTTAVLMLIIVSAQIFNYLLVNTGINRAVTTWLVELNLSKFQFFCVCVMIYLLLGCLMESVCMLYLTMPVLYPVVMALGFDPLWFAIIIVVLSQAACLTPPIGMNLFVIHGIAQNYPNPDNPGAGYDLGDVIKGSLPYLFIMLAFVFVLYLFPSLATWLPGTM